MRALCSPALPSEPCVFPGRHLLHAAGTSRVCCVSSREPSPRPDLRPVAGRGFLGTRPLSQSPSGLRPSNSPFPADVFHRWAHHSQTSEILFFCLSASTSNHAGT